MMKPDILKALRISALMFFAATLGALLTPHPVSDSADGTINLEELIPSRFGVWKIDPTVAPLAISPEVQANLNEIYSQTLSRTYINNHNERVMLSVAYGGTQSKSLQVHKPEVCYAAQGFRIEEKQKAVIQTQVTQIPVMHLIAVLGTRTEPITYWMRHGDRLVSGWFEQNLARIGYGLSGKITDGVLVRVSTISIETQNAFEVQQKFIGDLLASIEPSKRRELIGELASKHEL